LPAATIISGKDKGTFLLLLLLLLLQCTSAVYRALASLPFSSSLVGRSPIIPQYNRVSEEEEEKKVANYARQ
jgi:hypothetical protein